jgi:hypothetical protein
MDGQPLPQSHALRLRLAVVAGLFMAQQIPSALTSILGPAVFRKLGLPLESLPIFSLPLLPTATRWLWAPWVDRHFTRRGWIAACTGLGALLYAVLALVVPSIDGLALFITLTTVIALVMATQDIAVDAYVVESMGDGEAAAFSRVRLLATETGQLVAIAGLMLLYKAAGWTVAVGTAALLLALCTLPALWLGDPPRRRTAVPALGPTLARRDMQMVLLLVAATAFPAGIAPAIIAPFLVDKGLGIGQIGVALGLASSVAPIFSALVLAPVLIGQRRLNAAAWRVLPAAALAPAGLLALALWPQPGVWAVAITVFAGAFLAAPGFILIYAARLAWTSRSAAGTEFTLQESVHFLSRNVLTGLVAGPLAALIGWPGLFALNMALAGAAMLLLARHGDGVAALVGERHGREELA